MYYGLIADHKHHGHSRVGRYQEREKGGGREDIGLNGRKEEVGDGSQKVITAGGNRGQVLGWVPEPVQFPMVSFITTLPGFTGITKKFHSEII